MRTTEPSTPDHPLLARLPVAASAVRQLSGLGILQTFSEDIVLRGEACTEVTLERCL